MRPSPTSGALPSSRRLTHASGDAMSRAAPATGIAARYYMNRNYFVADPDAYFPLQTDVYVSPNGDNVRSFALREKPGAWYTRWWVWTIAGVAPAAAGRPGPGETTR